MLQESLSKYFPSHKRTGVPVSVESRSKNIASLLVANLVCLVFTFGLVALGVMTLDTYAGFFTKDVASIAEIIPIAGALSQFGIMLWCIAFSVAGFSAVLSPGKEEKKFLVYLAILSLILMLDDTFQVHERIFPKLFGLNELFIFTLEGALLVFIVSRFSDIVIGSRFILLLFAVIWFALSLSVDMFLSEHTFPRWHHLLEDGPKFLGIMNWCFYCALISFDLVGYAAVGKRHYIHPLSASRYPFNNISMSIVHDRSGTDSQ